MRDKKKNTNIKPVKEIYRITIAGFTEYIKVSDSRRIKPILRGKRQIPKKYLNENYGFNAKNQLIDLRTGALVPGNPKMVGKPRYWRVNGQDIFNQKIKHQQRADMVIRLHKFFAPIFEDNADKIKIKKYPIGLRLNFYVKDMEDHNIDNDNKWIWEKAIQDTLTEVGIIADDNPYIINENIKKTILVQNEEDVKMEIILYES